MKGEVAAFSLPTGLGGGCFLVSGVNSDGCFATPGRPCGKENLFAFIRNLCFEHAEGDLTQRARLMETFQLTKRRVQLVNQLFLRQRKSLRAAHAAEFHLDNERIATVETRPLG